MPHLRILAACAADSAASLPCSLRAAASPLSSSAVCRFHSRASSAPSSQHPTATC